MRAVPDSSCARGALSFALRDTMRFSTLSSRLQRLGAASATALGSGAVAHLSSAAESPHEDAMAQLRKQADKARQRAQERVRLGESEMGCSA